MSEEHLFFCITDERIVDGLYNSLKHHGLLFLVKEMGSSITERSHFQGISFCHKNTLHITLSTYYPIKGSLL